jgi:hypothetical protein
MCAETVQCINRILLDPPCSIQIGMNLGDSLVSRSRNTLTSDFLDSDCTDLLWIDSDLVFSGEHIKRIAGHDLDLVGGFYPKKQEGEIQWVCNCLDGNQPPPDPVTRLQSVKYIGTGFMRVRRRVFELMIKEHGERIGYIADGTKRQEFDFCAVGVHRFKDGTRRYLSEDWLFCQRWLDMGHQVWADAGVVLKHIGQAIYPLKSQCLEAGLPT